MRVTKLSALIESTTIVIIGGYVWHLGPTLQILIPFVVFLFTGLSWATLEIRANTKGMSLAQWSVEKMKETILLKMANLTRSRFGSAGKKVGETIRWRICKRRIQLAANAR